MIDTLKKIIPIPIKHKIRQAISRRRTYRPQIDKACAVEFVGTDNGGAPVCVEHLEAGSIVYSFGVGEDISFDLALIEQYGVEIHAFDPTPRSLKWIKSQTTPPQFHFHDYGIAAEDGLLMLYSPLNPSHVSYSVVEKGPTVEVIESPAKRMETIMSELGHSQVDVAKLDIEGAEFDVVADIARSSLNITQLIVEFHHNFPGLDINHTR